MCEPHFPSLVSTYSFHVLLLGHGHVLSNSITVLLWDVQPVPQLLDLLSIGLAHTLVLSFPALKLEHFNIRAFVLLSSSVQKIVWEDYITLT